MEKIIFIILLVCITLLVLLVLYGLVGLAMCYIDIFLKKEKPKNKVHFYVARDKNSDIYLYLGKPIRCYSNFVNLYGALGNFANEYDFKDFGLNPDDFKNLKWEDEPVEVFLNLKD